MSRLLFFAVIATVVYWLLKSYSKQLSKEEELPPKAEDMVRCAHCGVHVPKHEGILAGDAYYCSEAHRRAHYDKPE